MQNCRCLGIAQSIEPKADIACTSPAHHQHTNGSYTLLESADAAEEPIALTVIGIYREYHWYDLSQAAPIWRGRSSVVAAGRRMIGCPRDNGSEYKPEAVRHAAPVSLATLSVLDQQHSSTAHAADSASDWQINWHDRLRFVGIAQTPSGQLVLLTVILPPTSLSQASCKYRYTASRQAPGTVSTT